MANIDNNMHALLYAAAFGLIAAVVVAAIAIVVGKRRGESRSLAQALRGDHRGTILGLAVTAAILAAVWITVEIWDGYTRYAHFTAAVAMFAALAVAVEINARDCYRVQRISYARLYRAVACLMTASAVILVGGWDYEIFAVEVAEITLFAIFWLVQTRELWHNTVRSEPVDV